jgi:hypothetical protein
MLVRRGIESAGVAGGDAAVLVAPAPPETTALAGRPQTAVVEAAPAARARGNAPPPPLTEARIADALYLDQRAASRLIAPCFTPPDWHECDVMAVTRAGYFVEFEIKRSLADFRADARKSDSEPAGRGRRGVGRRKHDRLAAGDPAGPTRFWYVVPAGLIAPEQTPAWAGLRYAQRYGNARGRGVRLWTVKPAPRLHSRRVDPEAFERLVFTRLYHRYWWGRVRAGRIASGPV